ncbi:pseudouridine synthase [Xylariaceae sp. FL1272]|nr:pseudouridine synthase [Xylariaceae sp. FL1272]
MWSLTSGCRSWRPRSLPQILGAELTTAPQTCTFSTALIANVKISRIKKQKLRIMRENPTDYARWTKDALVARIKALENDLGKREGAAPSPVPAKQPPEVKEGAEDNAEPPRKKKKSERKMDPSKYSTRLVALKLAYLGKNYGGFEYQRHANVTIEEELWKALTRACLIFPENADEVNFEPWEYSKCGRTDRGVSAFGQVISIRLRSNKPLPKEEVPAAISTEVGSAEVTSASKNGSDQEMTDAPEKAPKPKKEWNDITDEIQYPRILNRLLPPDIRILAWCPTTPADFSARHHCRERQYRYFFTQPAYAPLPKSLQDPKFTNSKKPQDGWLDIEAMRTAAKKYEGLHDFRNFCKIDGSKQLTNFDRRIFESSIVEVKDAGSALPYLSSPEFAPSSSSPSPPSTTAEAAPESTEVYPKVYYFHVRGSAFLWHQIRCMVAILFMVGQGLEDASIIDRLLDIEAEPRRPNYVLANETPLVLWDCIFPKDLDGPDRTDGMEWIYLGSDNPLMAHGASGLVDHMWEVWRERKIDEVLAGQLLDVITSQTDIHARLDPRAPKYAPNSQKMFEGHNKGRFVGKYPPVLSKTRLATPQEANDKEAKRKGFENSEHMRRVIEERRAAAAASEKTTRQDK